MPDMRGKFRGESATVAAGCFSMGKEGWKEREPVHRVCLDAFEMDRTEVTLARYEKCVERGRCDPPEYFPEPPMRDELRRLEDGDLVLRFPPPYDPEDYWGKESIPGKRDCPVVGITWADADRYCREMGKRLPTEAEWEFALLAGDSVFRDTALELAIPKGWFAQNSRKQAHPVRRKAPNALGLYDMLGNAAEYVQDRYPDPDLASPPDRNRQGSAPGKIGVSRETHVVKGGGWADTYGPHFAYWRWSDAEPRSWWVGFRCARSLPQLPK